MIAGRMAEARRMSDTNAEHKRPKAAAGRRGLVLAACMMATFMTAVETTIVATAMPTIVADLGDFHLFSWVFAAVSAGAGGEHPDLRAAGRSLRAQTHFLRGRQRVPLGLDAVRLRAGHAVADRLPRAAGHRCRRRAAGGLHHRRRHLLADRAGPRPGLPLERLRLRRRRRADARRLPGRACRAGRSSSGSICRWAPSPSPCWRRSSTSGRIPGRPASTTSRRSC